MEYGECPNCGTMGYVAGVVYDDDEFLGELLVCPECGHEWHDKYEYDDWWSED